MSDPLMQAETRGRRLGRAAPHLALLALALPFIEPFVHGEYPVTDDGILALIRLVGLDHAVRHGLIWPRFMPALHYGYGSPLFNYSGPLSLYPAELLHLAGLGFIPSLLWATVLWGLFGMLGAYLLGRSLGSRLAGVVTGVAFLYSGQFDYFGNLAQFAALSFLPWALWAFRSLARRRRPRDFVLAVIFFAAPVLTHNITALVSGALVVFYCVYLFATDEARGKSALTLGAAVLGAVSVTAVVWLPALAEREAVQLGRLAFFDYRQYFLTLANVFVLPDAVNPARWFYPASPYAVHWPQLSLVLAATGLALWPRKIPGEQRRKRRGRRLRQVGYFLGAFALLLVLTNRVTADVWGTVPLMPYIEFPKRLLLPASLMIAVLAGFGADWAAGRLEARWARAAWLSACAGAIIVYSFPQLDLTYHDPQPQAESILDVQEIERQTGWLSGTSAGEYLPTWAPDEFSSHRYTDRFLEGEVIARLETSDDVQVLGQMWRVTSGDVQVEVTEPTTLVFDWFYFPGWQAWVDGQRVETRPVESSGLIGVDVPAGVHDVRVRFGLTPLRRAATLASVLTVVMLVVFVWRATDLWRGVKVETADEPPTRDIPAMLAASAVGTALFLVRLLL